MHVCVWFVLSPHPHLLGLCEINISLKAMTMTVERNSLTEIRGASLGLPTSSQVIVRSDDITRKRS